MADDSSFLHRWSRRKHEAARAAPAPAPAPAAAAPAALAPVPPGPGSAAPPAAVAAPAPAPAPAETQPLPPVESLTFASDFKPFLSAGVDETVKRAAMRKLFSDPHFNVMDGLDIYIDDYSKPDPMPEGLLDRLAKVYDTVEEKLTEAPPAEMTANAADTPEAPPAEAAASAAVTPAPAAETSPAGEAEPEPEPDPDEHLG